jgi:hypothetical protein
LEVAPEPAFASEPEPASKESSQVDFFSGTEDLHETDLDLRDI